MPADTARRSRGLRRGAGIGCAPAHAPVLAVTDIVSMDAIKGPETIKDDRRAGPNAQFEWKEARQVVRLLIKRLPDRERWLVEAYFYGEQMLDEVSKQLGCSKS